MCGIVGVRRFDGQEMDPALLRQMADPLEHRGPDDKGYWQSDGIALGHRRLSIIDVAGSPQPMSYADKTICFNGEVFNYQALRAELGARGHRFQTRGDTEVLLALSDEYGEAGVEHAQGQYAYAIWNASDSGLSLYRDRLGVVPLYYYWDGRALRRTQILGRRIAYHTAHDAIANLRELSVSIDVDISLDHDGGWKRKRAAELIGEFNRVCGQFDVVGIMSHHQLYEDEDRFNVLADFIDGISSTQDIQFSTLEEISDSL